MSRGNPLKQRPNHQLYLEALRRLGPEGRLRKAFELSEFSRALMRRGLEIAHPELSPDQLHELYLARLSMAQQRVD